MNNYPDVFNQPKNLNFNESRLKQLTTVHSSPYSLRKNVIQNNEVIETSKFKHVWSNQRGYGNIVFGKTGNGTKSQINVVPYNRIPHLKCPYSVDVNTESAWH